jgi:hypothetical protein
VRFFAGSLLAAFLGVSTTLSAQTTGAASLDQARDAWNRGEFQQAETLLVEALSRGGLKRDQTLECYVKLGSARAVLGRKSESALAFRQAALLDADFLVPADAGKRAVQAADAVKKQQAGFGVLALKVDVPTTAKPGAPLSVSVSIDPAHTTLIARVGLLAREPSTGKTFNFENAPSEHMQFTIPASLTLPNAALTIHVDALDKSDNQLAFGEAHVHVAGEQKSEDTGTKKAGGGFWSTPWPYLIGGAVLAGAAAGSVGLYFGLQANPNVNVGAPSVRPGG